MGTDILFWLYKKLNNRELNCFCIELTSDFAFFRRQGEQVDSVTQKFVFSDPHWMPDNCSIFHFCLFLKQHSKSATKWQSSLRPPSLCGCYSACRCCCCRWSLLLSAWRRCCCCCWALESPGHWSRWGPGSGRWWSSSCLGWPGAATLAGYFDCLLPAEAECCPRRGGKH